MKLSKEKIMEINNHLKEARHLFTLGLSEQELKIINYLRKNKRITSIEIQRMFDVSREMASRYLKRLIKLSIIERKGAGKNIYYIFKTK